MLKHKPIASTLAVALAATMLLFTSCVPENADPAADLPKGAIRLVSEGFRSAGGTKLGVDALGANVHFIAGDSLWVNGQPVEVKQSRTTAYIQLPDDMETSELIAVYPYSIVKAYDEGAGTIDVQLPGSYQYRVDPNTGRQNVQAPLFARLAAPSAGTNEGRTLQFSHLSAAITLAIKNSTSADIMLQNVELSQESGESYLWSCQKIYIDNPEFWAYYNNEPPIYDFPEIEGTGDDGLGHGEYYGESIHIAFGNADCIIPANETRYIQIPVIPIDPQYANPITVKVSAKHAEEAAITKFEYNYKKTQPNEVEFSLPGGSMDYAPIDLNPNSNDLYDGAFSVSATKKVLFSKGNLRYKFPAANETENENYFNNINNWAMNDNQYTINPITYTTHSYGQTPPCYVNENSVTGTTWLEFFMYGANGNTVHPRTAPNNPDANALHSNIQNTANDWGKRFGDRNWFTLTKDEWAYLFNTSRMVLRGVETTRAYYGRAAMWAIVNGVAGAIIFPDKYWYLSNTKAAYEVNETTTPKWSEMEKYGAVFLPTTGYLAFSSSSLTYGSSSTHVNHITNQKPPARFWAASTTDGEQDYIRCTSATSGQYDDNVAFTTAEQGTENTTRFMYAVRLVRLATATN